MSMKSEQKRAAIQHAYAMVLDGQATCDNVAFEAALMVYQRLNPDVSGDRARDDVSQIIADSVYRATVDIIHEAGGLEAIHARTEALGPEQG